MERRIYVVSIIVCIIIILLLWYRQDGLKDQVDFTEKALEWKKQEMVKFKDELGRERSTSAVLVAENRKQLSDLLGKMDGLTQEQQRVAQALKEYKNAVSVSTTTIETAINNKETNVTIGRTDDWPTYSVTLNDRWLKGDIFASKDSITTNLKIFNEFDFIQNRKKNFLKPDEYELIVKTLNKNSTTVGQSSVLISAKPKRIGVSGVIGYGVSKDGVGPFVGAGLSYQFISLW